VGLERGPLSLVSTTEELLGRKSSGSGLENRDHGCRSVGIVRSRTQGTEFFLCLFVCTATCVVLIACLFAATSAQQSHHKQNSYGSNCESYVQRRMSLRLCASSYWVPRHCTITNCHCHVLPVDHGRLVGCCRGGLHPSADSSSAK
jgi:hypothetical protein